jgi:hypothetical protein
MAHRQPGRQLLKVAAGGRRPGTAWSCKGEVTLGPVCRPAAGRYQAPMRCLKIQDLPSGCWCRPAWQTGVNECPDHGCEPGW